jgi:hypothetical protein
MKKILYASSVAFITLLSLLTSHLPIAHSEPRPYIYSGNATGMTFTIDGNPSDWETLIPSLELNTQENPDKNYPVPSYVYFMNDTTDLYVLVDATGDTTDGLDSNCAFSKNCCDECYLRFDTSRKVIEVEIGIIYGAFLTADFNPPDVEASIGFGTSVKSDTPHRIYEMKIPLSAIQAYPGQVINFFSPLIKEICDPYGGSIPFDGGTALSGDWKDNVYPFWLVETDVNTWAQLVLSNAHAVQKYTLAVDITGTGSGTVTISPGGIDCRSDCSKAYSQGTTVTLTATPDAGSTFTGWSGGGCSGTGACTVTLNSDTIITAAFFMNCAYTISPANKTFKSTGGNLSVKVTATGQNNCPAPSISIDDDWIFQSGAISWKNNKGTVKIVIQKNTTSQNRTGVIWIGGKALTIEEYGTPCQLTALKPSSLKFKNGGGTGSFNVVVSPQDCAWNISTTSNWIHLDTLSGTGNGTAAFHIDMNTTGKNRTGKIDASLATDVKKKKTFSLTQNK